MSQQIQISAQEIQFTKNSFAYVSNNNRTEYEIDRIGTFFQIRNAAGSFWQIQITFFFLGQRKKMQFQKKKSFQFQVHFSLPFSNWGNFFKMTSKSKIVL